MPSVTVGTFEIAYRETGAGDPIVFVNGTGESGQSWIGQTTEFSDRYRCVTPDNRDCGDSSYATEPYGPAEIASDTAGLIDALGLGPSHVVGYSLGGAAAQELAIVRPDLVRSLVLLSTWAATDAWFAAQIESWKSLRLHHRDDEQAFLLALFPWIFAPRTYQTPNLVDGYVTMSLAEEPRQRVDGFLRQCDADIAHDAAARLGGVQVPTLVIVGEHDICTPLRYAQALCALIDGAALEVIPETGHGAVFERPDLINAAISQFLARTERS